MARIDLLTAQMCRRAARRLCVRSDEKMQFFSEGGELLSEGAVLSGAMIHEFLLPIAPIPFDGVPVSFPYKGCDGDFKILVDAHCRGFEIQSLSLAAPQTPPTFPPLSASGTPRTAFDGAWATSGNSYTTSVKQLNGPGRGTYVHREDAPKHENDSS